MLISEQQRKLMSRSISLNSLSTLKTQAVEARAFSSLLENILPLKDQLIHFPRDIEEIARRGGLEFGSTFGEERGATAEAPGYIGFTFTIGGSYEKIINFLREVERGRYIVAWENMDISERAGTYRGNISGKVFSR
jgi:Tfp pilus assembly protein PilO